MNQSFEIVIELQLHLNPETFEKVYIHNKAKYELSLMKKKEKIAVLFDYIKEICDAFPEIKFDAHKMCFYNESEEIQYWNADSKLYNEHQGKDFRREKSDCCSII